MARTISHSFVPLTREILFLPLEHKIHIFSPPCNILYIFSMARTISWQEQYLTRSFRSLVRYCSCHSNIKFISSRHRVISSIYLVNKPLRAAGMSADNVRGINFGLQFWVDNNTHFRSFCGLFLCFRERAFIVRKTKVATIEA